MNILASLQSYLRIVCNLLDKGFWGGRVHICPMVFHDVVEECLHFRSQGLYTEEQDTSPSPNSGVVKARKMARAWRVSYAP